MSDIANLRKRGHDLMSMFDESLNWLKKSGNLDRHNKGKLEDAQRTVRKVSKVLDKKPVFGLFGQSQAGKSYLAHIILSNAASNLTVNLGGDTADFIKEINPVGGGVESTGVVTRFTVDPVQDSDFPVVTRFLTLEDVCLVLCKAYYLNLQGNPLDVSAVETRVKEVKAQLETMGQGNPSPKEDLVYSLKDLEGSLIRFFPSYNHFWDALENSGFWQLAEQNLGALSRHPKVFAKLMSVLWMDHDGLGRLAEQLFDALTRLNWSEQGCLKGSAVLRNEGAIVDVSTLQVIGDGDELDVKTSFGVHGVNRGILSALTKEVVLNIQVEEVAEDSYLNRADILDFPGARSAIDRGEADDDITLPFLRGKVEHLFQQYSLDYEINNLLFCIPDKQSDVKNLPSTVGEWIHRNVGDTPEARQKLIQARRANPFMIVCTMFDKQLEFNEQVDHEPQGLEKRWEKRFFTLVQQTVIQGRVWDEQWTPDESFQNLFPLRDFSWSKHTFEGFNAEQNSPERVLKEFSDDHSSELYDNRAHFHQALKDSFIASEHTNRYLKDPESAWNSFALPNKNGSGPIIDAMQEASRTTGLATHATNILDQATEVLNDLMGKHYHSDDIAAMHNKAEGLAARLDLLFNSCVPLRRRDLLMELQSQLLLDSNEVSEWLALQPSTEQVLDQKHIEEFLMMHQELNAQMTGTECMEAFRIRYRLSGHDEARDLAWNEFNVDLNRLFDRGDGRDENPTVSKAVEHFAKVKLEFDDSRHSRLITLGMDADDLKALLSQLNHGLETRQMASRISEFLSGQPNLTMAGEVDALRMGALIAHHWNEYVFHLSGSFFTAEEGTTLQLDRSARDTNPQEVFDKMTEMFGSEPLANLPKVHFAPAHRTVMQWHERLRNLFLVNCGFANYDMEQNEELGQILQRIERVS